MKPKTKLAGLGRRKDWTHGVVNPPVYRASTCLFETYEDYRAAVAKPDETLFYGRRGTPTHWALREAITDLHAGAGTWLFPSGVAAINGAILSVAGAGDHILVPDSAYEPTRIFANRLAKHLGIQADFYDPLAGSDIAALFQENTRLIVLESPGSLTFEVQDIPAIVAAAQDRGIMTVADNTWATPLYFRPLEHGVDLVMEACTKYFVGHSDVMMGSVTASEKAWPRLKRYGVALGQTVSPDDAYLTLRGMRTLDVRLAAHTKAALSIAKTLKDHPLVAKVLHPALPDCPGHAVWQRDFDGASGLFSIVMDRFSTSGVIAMVDHMHHFKMGFSWGGYESLILPADPSHSRSATHWNGPGELFRLQIGLEDEADLLADLLDGLKRFQASS